MERQAAQVSALSGCAGSEGELETIRRKVTDSRKVPSGVTQIEEHNRLKADTCVYPLGLDGANTHFTGGQGSPDWRARCLLPAIRTHTHTHTHAQW